MDEQLKTYWKLYGEYFSNEEILRNFTNLMDVYHPLKSGKIIDIGCGQSKYLLDFHKNSDHQLIAIDDEPIQINALKKRIEKVKSKNQITFYTAKFPNKDLINIKFTGVIVSNLLHFMKLSEAKDFISDIEKHISTGSIILFTTHSWKHSSNGDYSYFKHYFKEEDFHYLLPKQTYDYLYIDSKSASHSNKKILFLKKWIKLVANQNEIFESTRIQKMQRNYLENSDKIESITVVVRRK